MKKLFKWTGIVLGGLIAQTFLTGLVLYPIGMKSILGNIQTSLLIR